MIKEMLSMSALSLYWNTFNELTNNEVFGITNHSSMYKVLMSFIYYDKKTIYDFVTLSKDELLELDLVNKNNVQHYIDLQSKIIAVYGIEQPHEDLDPTDLYNPEC